MNRIQKKLEQARKDIEDRQRKNKIIKLIRDELNFNWTELESKKDKNSGNRVVHVEPLKDESWKALSDGGELQYINDPKLLDQISETYYYIRIIKYLEEKYFESIHFPGVRIQQNSPPQNRILDYINKSDGKVINKLSNCIKTLDDIIKDK